VTEENITIELVQSILREHFKGKGREEFQRELEMQ